MGNGTNATVDLRNPRNKSTEGNVVSGLVVITGTIVLTMLQIMWAACLDSADSHEVITDEGRHKGAMSHAFQQCIRESE